MNILKMTILLKLLYRFKTIPIKIPISFLTELWEALLNFIWNLKRFRIAKALYNNTSKDIGIIVLVMKLYYTTIVVK